MTNITIDEQGRLITMQTEEGYEVEGVCIHSLKFKQSKSEEKTRLVHVTMEMLVFEDNIKVLGNFKPSAFIKRSKNKRN